MFWNLQISYHWLRESTSDRSMMTKCPIYIPGEHIISTNTCITNYVIVVCICLLVWKLHKVLGIRNIPNLGIRKYKHTTKQKKEEQVSMPEKQQFHRTPGTRCVCGATIWSMKQITILKPRLRFPRLTNAKQFTLTYPYSLIIYDKNHHKLLPSKLAILTAFLDVQ